MYVCKFFKVLWRKLAITVQPASDSRFVDLAPTEEADNADIYFEAFEYAINRPDVLNIALTGPYGSGKSSVIKSFLIKHPELRALKLSLASFSTEVDSINKAALTKKEIAENKQEVERSILQQILYVLETDKLPFSRFKRIQVPKQVAIVNSLFITVGLVCVWHLFSKQTDVLSGDFFKPFGWSNWLNYLSIFLAAVFAWKVIHSVYTTSFGLSLKSLSLKDVQIAPRCR
ncbi:YobI family P-loop NTPase [Brucella pseudogrignonensis]